MSDYGHDLMFGAFLTPAAERSAEVVALTQLSEQIGLDLATFQDHPYLPAFLDTSTLLSFVAARTNTIRLSTSVTNLPLRPPAVLARSLASLDLLTGGRIELGLGAGAFWDGIEAMGGRRLSAGQAVQALEEAITIVRAIWDADGRGGVRVDGEHYRVVGAKRGPAPAHAIEIWLGAYKPRMLAMTGRVADGWLPSQSYLNDGDLAAGNAVIDDAAQQAGRSPGDIRRLLNISGEFLQLGRGPLQGPAEQWSEQLADVALTDGISVFILGSDDPDDLRRFGGEVAPAVRERVTAERRPTPAVDSGTARVTTAERGPLAVTPTADDGVRRSDVRVWDETTRPEAPPADSARGYTATEQANGGYLVQIHDGLRAELAEIFHLLDQVADKTMDPSTARAHINTMTMRQNNWTVGTYCEAYCRIVTLHHTLEDHSVFPRLLRAEPQLAPVVERLQHEHVVIHDVLERVDRALVALVSQPDGTARLRDAVDLLSDTLLSHLAYEERELVEPLARLGLL